MNNYIVQWEMDIEASSPQDAAEKAWSTLQNPKTTATLVKVMTEDTFDMIKKEKKHARRKYRSSL